MINESFEESLNLLNSALKCIGLTNSEIKVYKSLLKYGLASPNTLSILTKIPRPSCYDHLKSLHKLGLVFKTNLSNKIAYGIEDPAKIISILKNNKQNIDLQMTIASSAIKNMRVRYKKFSYPKIKYYEGFEGIKEMYKSTLLSKDKEILAFFFGEFYPEELNEYILEDYIPSRVNNKINVDLLTDLSFLDNKDKKQLRTRTMVKQSKFPKVEINIYDENVLFISFSQNLYTGIKIENKEISDALRELHHIIKLSNS